MATPFVATCRCGALTFTSSRAPVVQLTCHCHQCRQASGTPFTNLAMFKVAETAVVGPTTAQHFIADSGAKTVRESCAACGTVVLDRTEGFPQLVGVVAERLQAPYAFEPRCHVWTESKLADVAVSEQIKSFARGMT
jgi:hypothetical protein